MVLSERGFNFHNRGNLGLIDLNSTWIRASFLTSSTDTINQNGPRMYIPTSGSNIWGAWGTSESNSTGLLGVFLRCSIKKNPVGKIGRQAAAERSK